MALILFRILLVLLSMFPPGNQDARKITFAHLADLHVNPGSESETNLNLLVDDINLSNVDFVIVNGDLSNAGSDAELNSVKKALLRLTKPCYVLPGNHETNWSESAGLYFNRLWGDDRFIFSTKGFRLAGLSTGPFMRMGDGHVKKEDISWLASQLSTLKKDRETLVFFSHYPLAEGLDNWFEVTDVLRSNNCRLCFCGHGHKLTLLNFDGMTGIMGRAVLTAGSEKPGYNIVEILSDSVKVYNKEPGSSKGLPVLSLDYSNPATVASLARSPRPDYSVNSTIKDKVKVKEFSDQASIFTGPCLVNDSVMVYGNSVGDLKALNTITGSVIWTSHLASPVYSTPVSYNGVVALGTVDGNISGFSAANGKLLWKVTSGRPVLAEGLCEKGNLYIGAGDREFYKIDIATGKILWKFSGVEGLIQGKTAISEDFVIFGAWDRHLYCLDKKSGSLRWKWNNGKPQQLYSPGNIVPVVSGKVVFIVAPDRFMTAINIDDGKEIWRTGKHMVRESMGISADGKHVYAKLMNDTLIAMSAVQSMPVTIWAKDQGFGYEHNPCPVKAGAGMIVNGTRTGMIIASDPSSGDVLWRYKAGNSSVISIVIDSKGAVLYTLAEGKAGRLVPGK